MRQQKCPHDTYRPPPVRQDVCYVLTVRRASLCRRDSPPSRSSHSTIHAAASKQLGRISMSTPDSVGYGSILRWLRRRVLSEVIDYEHGRSSRLHAATIR